MRAFLRTLAFPVACAFTGAASALLTAHLLAAPAPTCPQGPVLELRQVATALAGMHVVPPAPAALPDGAVRHLGGRHYIVDRAALAGLLDGPTRHGLRILPSVRDGQAQGLKIYGLRPGSLPNRLGLKNGDLVVAINGARLASMHEAQTVARQLPTADRIAVDLVRKGEPLRIELLVR